MNPLNVNDKVKLQHNDGRIIEATVIQIYNTKPINYKLESPAIQIPLYFSQPVLEKLLIKE